MVNDTGEELKKTHNSTFEFNGGGEGRGVYIVWEILFLVSCFSLIIVGKRSYLLF
jgi:hypothetical protein